MSRTMMIFAFAATVCGGFRQQGAAIRSPRRGLTAVVVRGTGRQHLNAPAWPGIAYGTGGFLSSTSFKATPDTSEDTVPSSTPDSTSKRLSQAYRVAQYAYGTAAAMIFCMPDRTLTTLLATKWGGSAGFCIAAGLSRILRIANEKDRLSSDTYKRLNLGLLGFSSLGLTALPGEAAFLNSPVAAMVMSGFLTMLRLFGTVLAFTGWKRGVKDGSPKGMLTELVQGTKDTLKGLKVEFSKKALTYRNCLLLVCMGIVSSFMEGLFNLRYQKEFTRTWFEISLQWSAVARLFMIATMIYSLKDAAERDRLTGTTFIELNVMVGGWALLVGLGQAVYPLGFAAYRGVEMFALSITFFLKAYKSQKHRKKAAKKEEST